MRHCTGTVALLLFLSAAFALAGRECQAGEAALAKKAEMVKYSEARPMMDTVCRVTVFAPTKAEGRAAVDAAFAEMQRLIKVFNDYDPESEISRLIAIQNQPKRKTTFVSEDMSRCLVAARRVWQESGGAFDPTVGQLVDFWKSCAKKDYLPTPGQTKAVAELVGFENVLFANLKEFLHEERAGKVRTKKTERVGVFFKIIGMRLDLGGIAKGYIAQRAAEAVKKRGIKSALIDTGGNISCLGSRPDGKSWLIGVQDPREPDNPKALLTRIRLSDAAVSTSAHYWRFFEITEPSSGEKKRFSHIIDPRTGQPAAGEIASVTVVGPDAAICDGYSTAIAVLGVEEGIKMIEAAEGYECLLVLVDGKGKLTLKHSSGFSALEEEGQAAE